MKLTLAQLEALHWIARLGSVRAAATRLSISQPALSLRIKELEATLGGRVINRSSYRASLTTFGLEVAQQAGEMLSIAERISDRVAPSRELKGLVRMGSTDTFAQRYLPALLADIEQHYPQAQVELVVDFSANLQLKLLAGEIDVAVLTPSSLPPLLAAERLIDMPHYWVGTPRRLGKLDIGTPASLVNLPIISHAPPSLLFDSIRSWFAGAGLAPLRFNTCTSLFIIKALTCQGIGISLLPVEIIAPEVRAGELRILKARPSIASHPLHIAYRRDMPLGNLERFIERVRASAGQPLRRKLRPIRA
ncbi:MAG: LysR family transcriptional regulator [Burkholderiales bacterium]